MYVIRTENNETGRGLTFGPFASREHATKVASWVECASVRVRARVEPVWSTEPPTDVEWPEQVRAEAIRIMEAAA